jgi:hypothetical protein
MDSSRVFKSLLESSRVLKSLNVNGDEEEGQWRLVLALILLTPIQH